MQMSTTSRPRIKSQSVVTKCQVEIVDLKGSYLRSAGPILLKTVLGYLVLNYWGHRSGWPDLLVYRTNQWFLAEVKSCSDKLNENQKRWIEDNHRYLHLPFKLVHVHRMEADVSASAVGSRAGLRDRALAVQRC
jgi:VRR-NUC domain